MLVLVVGALTATGRSGSRRALDRAILAQLDHPLVTVVDTMDGAADKAAELAHGA